MTDFLDQIRQCMEPTAALLARTEKPLHRAMLLNFWRHVHLEGAGEYQAIVADDMTVEHPVYRVSWGNGAQVVEGRDAVLAFYRGVGETVLWHSDDNLAVADWGICDEITFHQLATGASLRAVGYEVDDPDAYYHVASRQAFIWPYDPRALLVGEHLYEDRTSLVIEPVPPEEVVTPAQAQEVHRRALAELEAARGPGFWRLDRQH